MRSAMATRHGWHGSERSLAFRLALAFDVLFGALILGLAVGASAFGPPGGEGLSESWIFAGLALGAAAAALAGGAVALVAVIRGSREPVAIPLAIGGVVLFFLIGMALM